MAQVDGDVYMSLYEQLYNLVWVAVGIWICLQSTGLKVWGPVGPGAGFIPFVAALFIIVCGILLLLLEFSKGAAKDSKDKFWEHPQAWKRIICILSGFFAMALLMPILGFFLTSFIIMVFLVRVVEHQKLIKVMILSFICCFSLYVFFNYILDIRLPKGPLRF